MTSKETYFTSTSSWLIGIAAICLLLQLGVGPCRAQSTSDVEALQKRLARARALSAAHSLQAAASELSSIVHSTTDDAVREVARIMLMGVYSEEADYTEAESLLEEVFKSRSQRDEGSIRTYFALAGRAVSGAREHLERYRAFGINVADSDLPNESVKDLDRLRSLLERIAAQAKELAGKDSRTTDAAALLEDVARVRYTLSRDEDERSRWQQEFGVARRSLAASETHVTMSGDTKRSSVGDTGSPEHNPSEQPRSTTDTPSPVGAVQTTVGASDSSGLAAGSNSKSSSNADGSKGSAPAHDSASSGGPLEVGSLSGKATKKITPSYPTTARNAHVSGVVTVYLVVNEKGDVSEVGEATGPQLLRQAAVDAAWRWRFRPTMVEGRPVRVTGFLSFNFAM